jgi:hypothetical protein
MRASRLPILWFTAALILGGAGCEIIAKVDRSQIGDGTGGSGGSGGATSSVTSAVSSTSTGLGGSGGSGGTGGTGGSGGTGGATASSSASGTGGAGGATSSSSSSASGTGGAGGMGTVCTTAADCPPPAGECITATCTAGVCGTVNVPAGTATMMQTPGNCLKSECDGNGAIVTSNDDTDVNDDSNPCTTDTCSGGVASHTPVAAGTACGVGQACDAAGSCTGCVTAVTCPGIDDECKTRTCTANVCGFSFTAAGTAVAAQTAADCKKNQCDGAGAIVPVADDTDLPVDNLECTNDVCTAGAPTNPPVTSGTACTQNGGTTCNGGGQCVQCLTASTCPGQDTDCQTRTCLAGTCGFSFVASGTPTPTGQTAADCQKSTCNGAGGVVSVADDTDLPVDSNACTSDVCTAGVPSNPPTASGTACSQNGGTTCNGAGQCVQCVTATTCPGQDTECQVRSCVANTCGVAFTPAGTPTAAQTAGDCKQNECDGAGAIASAAHDTDLPVDANLCTSDVCTAGVPSNPPVSAGSPCGIGLMCDATGTCLGCNTGADCPGSDTECQTRTCVANTCGVAFAPAGTATAAQTAGDCKQNECNGAGLIVIANHDTDVPSDAFQCTADTCTAGVPTFTPVALGTACTDNGGTTCDAIGDCVQCNTGSDCPGSDTDCHTRTCLAGTCGVFNTAAGNPTTTQTAGNCQVNQCDGAGNAANVVDNADIPVDSNQCTGDVCTAGVPSNPNLASGTVCTQNGGTTCDGAGTCTAAGGTPTDFVVLRLGDGVTALSGAAAAGNLEHRLIDGTSVGTIALPTAANGANKPLTFAGTSTSEGGVSRSADGHYVTLGGYAAAPGTAAIAGTTSAATNRVVGRVDASNVVDTTTLFTSAFSGGNIRSATSNDGTGFWASGSLSAVQYIPFGTTTATQLNTAPTNIRFLHIFNSQLYGTSGSGAFVNVFTVGTGLPTTAGQTATSFAGMPTATASPYSFVLLDRNAAVAGLDTLYVADDRASASGGGIQKWTFNGTTWTLGITLTAGTTGFRGLAGVVTGANVTLIATTTAATANTVVAFVDDGSAAPAGTVIATAPALTVYRGIAFAPH